MSETASLRVDTVFLPVRSINRAAQWYQEKLGWLKRAVALKMGQTAFTLHTDDIEIAHTLLQQNGVEVSDIHEFGGIKSFTFKDLDGNVIGVSSS